MGKYKIYNGKTTVRDFKISSISFPKNPTEALKNLFINTKRIFVASKTFIWINPNTYTGLRRLAHQLVLLAITVLIIFSAISPLFELYISHKYYSLNSQTSTLVGNVGSNLAKQISYDYTADAYIFNKDGMKAMTTTVGPDKVPLALLQAKVAGNKSKSKSLYAVSMPTDPKAGITYFDSNTGLSFSLVPNFTQMSAKQVDNHIVYPINKDMQMVYTVKSNGLKEDIIMKKFTTDSFSYSYSLKLPNTLEARMLNDGSDELGIYSADPALFTGGSSLGNDTAKIESAKIHAQKTNLLFAIPAPVINQTGNNNQATKAKAIFALSNDKETLTVTADNLKTLHYPVSVDPTVVITSTSDFAQGNNEDNNISYPGNQINGGALTGGSISGGWTSSGNPLPTATYGASSVAYNGYVYEIGGSTGSAVTTVEYAVINSNGTIGSWAATTPLLTATSFETTVAYNGYLFEIGGNTGVATAVVDYAPINANGTIGSWTATTSIPAATYGATSVAYNGYVYEIGGANAGVATTVVDYAPINANGTIGTWTATTPLPVATYAATSVVYDGYVYEIGGIVSGSAVITIDYAPIKADGTIGSWTATTALPVGTYYATSVVYSGYLYEIGGTTTSVTAVVDYAPINANGTIGSWTATTSLTAVTNESTSVVYNGYIYEIGGFNGAANVATVNYAKIDPPGYTTSYTSTTALGTAIYCAASVSYNGYIYEIGGFDNTVTAQTTVKYAALSSNGTVGSWSSTSALTAASAYGAATVYNGYVYLVGGKTVSTPLTTVEYALINSGGTLGAWANTTALGTGVVAASTVAYNGYLYVMGGYDNASFYYTTVSYGALNNSGTVVSWSTTNTLPNGTGFGTAVTYQGYIYYLGGTTGTTASAVYYASFGSSGTLSIWTTASSSLPSATRDATSVVYNGYIYEIGGKTGATTTTVSYVPINTDGSLGGWVTNYSLPAATQNSASAVFNGFIYEIGGYNGSSVVATVYYSRINNSGPGTAGSWTAINSLPTATYQSGSVAYNGYLYEIGGYTTTNTALIDYAVINSNGTIGTWTAASNSLPVAISNHSVVAYNGFLYVIGGNKPAYSAVVYYAPINSNGSIGTWNTTTSVTTARSNAAATAYNGYIYYVGGFAGGSGLATVDYAPINTTGTLGTWNTTTSIPAGSQNPSVVTCNGYIYDIGGYTTTISSLVYYAPLNSSNGTVGTWVATSSLPVGSYQATAVVYDGYIYQLGGGTVSYGAPINTNGTLGSWILTASVSANNYYQASAVAYNGYLYYLGGANGGPTNGVYSATLNVMPRIGHYSQIFNFGSLVNPASISYNGALKSPVGITPITYETAGSNGVFGTSAYSTSLVGSSTTCIAPGSGTAQYVLVSVTLDDSRSASFPDVNYSPTNVTDFTVSMAGSSHPSQNVRLHGGKFFASEVLQSLDTCGP